MTRTGINEVNGELVSLLRLDTILRGRDGLSAPQVLLRISVDKFSGLITSVETLIEGEANPRRDRKFHGRR